MQVFLGCLHRMEAICGEQDVWHYVMDVQTKAFHEEPYKNGATRVRKDFCRSDHADDIMYVFGMMFDPDFHFPEGRQFADDEREASKRVMKAWSNFARNGNPGWDKFNLEHQTMMRFSTPNDVKTTAEDNYTQRRLKLWRSRNPTL